MKITFRELRKRMPALIKWGGAVEIMSSPGRGKSTFIEGVYEDMSRDEPGQWGLVVENIARYTPVDLNGFMVPKFYPNEPGKHPDAQFTRPAWARTRCGRSIWDFPKGILFLDEFGQGDVDVKKGFAGLLLDKRMGPWTLPPGWVVWAASNFASDRSGVTKSLDFIINRRLEVQIQDDLESLETWLLDNGVHPLITAFAHQNPDVVFTDGVPDKQGPWMTPRTLVMASKLLGALATDQEKLVVDSGAITLVSGLVGEGAATKLMAFLKTYDLLPTYTEVLADPAKAKCPGKDRPDAAMTIAYALGAKVKVDDAAKVIAYMDRLPKEYGVVFAKVACRKPPEGDGRHIVNTKAMGEWMRANPSLVAAVSAARG